MALVLHKGRLDRHGLPSLLSPYVGRGVLVHLACEDRFLSWKGKGVLRSSPTGDWCLHHELEGDPVAIYDAVPFDQVVGHECVLSVIPEPETSNGADVDDLIKQAQSLVGILNAVKRA